MPRAKNYKVSKTRSIQPRVTAASSVASAAMDVDTARIDMVALLGESARFAANGRFLDLREWLGREVDAWVLASVACLKALLLSGTRETSTVASYCGALPLLFAYLTEGRETARVSTPAALSPLHFHEFVGWLQKRASAGSWTPGSTRERFSKVKSVLMEMFKQGFIPGEPSRFFKRATLPSRGGESRHTSLSDAEQHRVAQAVREDLVAIHHGRLMLSSMNVQALRLLLVAHRQGLNPTPLLELRRDALAPGILPGTIRIRTAKHRNKKLVASVGRAVPQTDDGALVPEQDLAFPLAEGVILQQAITSTESLIAEAPAWCRNRVWLYRSEGIGGRTTRGGEVTCLSSTTLRKAIVALVKRHGLVGDDGQALMLNLSRLRKSRFDRALRLAEGDLTITANLMGNTPRVAGVNYPSMNGTRKAEAAGFMNDDYVALMRDSASSTEKGSRTAPRVMEVRPYTATGDAVPAALPENTPMSGCMDTLSGEYAPHDGHNHCDRYVMCLFCSSFAIVGTADELWRLFSFQVFARAELEYLDAALGLLRTTDADIEDLRDRYRLAIPFIDDFTRRQFSARTVAEARARTDAALHPFWRHQMTLGRAARAQQVGPDEDSGSASQTNAPGGQYGS